MTIMVINNCYHSDDSVDGNEGNNGHTSTTTTVTTNKNGCFRDNIMMILAVAVTIMLITLIQTTLIVKIMCQ